MAATCLSFPSNDVNKFIVGSEECTVYQGQRHGSKPGITLQFEGHWGPVTSISSHQAAGQVSDYTALRNMLPGICTLCVVYVYVFCFYLLYVF